jgi:hypothetical protein
MAKISGMDSLRRLSPVASATALAMSLATSAFA